jgi:hypothetical protein
MRIALALFVLALMASCVAPPAPRPAAPVARTPAMRSVPPIAPAPLPADWRDWPLTPGNWRYGRDQAGTRADFSPAGVTLSCDNDRQLRLSVGGRGPAPITIRTSTVSRTATPTPAGQSRVAAALMFTPRDPLLDAIAFSRGRWTIEQAGARPLVLPAYAEVARVVEDCRG